MAKKISTEFKGLTITTSSSPIPSTSSSAPTFTVIYDNATTEWKCKTCLAPFPTLQECLQHETIHLEPEKAEEAIPKKRKKKSKSKKGANVLTPGRITYKKVDNYLSKCSEQNIFDQIQKLFQPNLSELRTVCVDIKEDLTNDVNHFDQFEVLEFGSSVTRTALLGSDIDFCLYPKGDLLLEDPHKVFSVARKYLHKSKNFKIIFAVKHTSVPIIKCLHKKSGYNLDINTSSRFGVFNSDFLVHLFKFNPIIYQMSIIIRIWAQQIELSKHMVSYCLIWLVIYYLQNTTPPIIPPIRLFQVNSPIQTIVDGKNYTFDHDYVHDSQNPLNLIELLTGFFSFYMNFDFESKVICPYLGVAIERDNFLTMPFEEYQLSMKTQDPAQHLKLATSIVVQDPFYLNQNIAVNVPQHFLNVFKHRLNVAYMIFTNEAIPRNVKYIQLFHQYQFQKVRKIRKKKVKLVLTVKARELFSIRHYLNTNYPNQTFDKIVIQQFWSKQVFDMINHVLQNTYKLHIELIEGSMLQLMEIDKNIEIFAMRKYDISKNVDVLEKDLPFDFSNNIKCYLTIALSKTITEVILTFENTAEPLFKGDFKRFFNHFGSHIRDYLLEFLHQTLAVNQQPNISANP